MGNPITPTHSPWCGYWTKNYMPPTSSPFVPISGINWFSCPQAMLEASGNIWFITSIATNPDELYIIKHNFITGEQSIVYHGIKATEIQWTEPTIGIASKASYRLIVLNDNLDWNTHIYVFLNETLLSLTYTPNHIIYGIMTCYDMVCSSPLIDTGYNFHIPLIGTGTGNNFYCIDAISSDGINWTYNEIIHDDTFDFYQLKYFIRESSVGVLYFFVADNKLANHRLYKSINGGITWNFVANTPCIYSGTTTNCNHDAYIFHNNLYIIGPATYNGIYPNVGRAIQVHRSEDGGLNWTPTVLDPTSDFLCGGTFISYNDVLYVLTVTAYVVSLRFYRRYKLWQSSDGITWSLISDYIQDDITGTFHVLYGYGGSAWLSLIMNPLFTAFTGYYGEEIPVDATIVGTKYNKHIRLAFLLSTDKVNWQHILTPFYDNTRGIPY